MKSSVRSAVKYDLICKLGDPTELTPYTIGWLLESIGPPVFGNPEANPDDFLRNAARLINEQKATVAVDYLTSSTLEYGYFLESFSEDRLPVNSIQPRITKGTYMAYWYREAVCCHACCDCIPAPISGWFA
jgi:restriction endonuclease